jgi:CRP-like cAMP-binding protein
VNGSDVSRIRSDVLLDAVAEAGRTGRFAHGTPKLVAQVLGEMPIFAGLGNRQRRRIAEACEVAQVKTGEAIVREGFTGQAAFVLLTGTACVERSGAPVVDIGSGAVIGELSLLCGEPRSATVRATCDLWVLRIRREDFQRLVAQEPTIAVHLLETLSRRLWDVEHTPPETAATTVPGAPRAPG